MKQSNLALRADLEEPDNPAAPPQSPIEEESSPAAQRLARTRALGMDYRAILIGDEGLRMFRIR